MWPIRKNVFLRTSSSQARQRQRRETLKIHTLFCLHASIARSLVQNHLVTSYHCSQRKFGHLVHQGGKLGTATSPVNDLLLAELLVERKHGWGNVKYSQGSEAFWPLPQAFIRTACWSRRKSLLRRVNTHIYKKKEKHRACTCHAKRGG